MKILFPFENEWRILKMVKITVVRFGHFPVHRGTLFNTCFYRFFGALSSNLGSFLSSVTWFWEYAKKSDFLPSETPI